MKTFLDQIQNSKKNSIEFYPSCANSIGKCIKDFSGTNVQMIQAIAIAQEYAKAKDNIDIICSATYRTKLNDDYIKCSDKTGATNHYEFQFDDVKESIDNTIKTDVLNALCKIYNGQINPNNNTCYFYKKLNGKTYNTEEDSKNYKSALSKFGYNASCQDHSNFLACATDFNSKKGSDYELKTAFGIDPRKFVNLQLQSASDMEFLLKRYTQQMILASGQKLTDFRCNKSFNTYHTGQLTNPKDDILTCIANGKQIDFLFDDINENFDYKADAGTAGLNCIADTGGTFDGRNCHGLTMTQCKALNEKLPGGTTWDVTLDTCTLNAAATASNIDKYTSAATTVGVSAGLLVVTIMSGGSAVFIVAGAAGTLGASAAEIAQNRKEAKTIDFLATSTKCKNPQCAESTLKEFIHEVVQYYDDIDGQLLNATDQELARLLNLIPGDSELLLSSIEHAVSDSQNIRNFSNWSNLEKLSFASNVAIAIGAVAGLTSAAKATWASICTKLKNITPPAATLSVLSTGPKMTRAINAVSNIGSTADGVNSLRGIRQ